MTPRLSGTAKLLQKLLKTGQHLDAAGEFIGFKKLAERLGVSPETARRWTAHYSPRTAYAAWESAARRGGATRTGVATARATVTPENGTKVAEWLKQQEEPPTAQRVAYEFNVSVTTARRLCAAAGHSFLKRQKPGPNHPWLLAAARAVREAQERRERTA